jgi:hypothetical protein
MPARFVVVAVTVVLMLSAAAVVAFDLAYKRRPAKRAAVQAVGEEPRSKNEPVRRTPAPLYERTTFEDEATSAPQPAPSARTLENTTWNEIEAEPRSDGIRDDGSPARARLWAEKFAAEPESRRGSRMESEIRDVVKALGTTGLNLQELRCRSSTCKMVASFDSQSTYNQAFQRLFVVNREEDGERFRLYAPAVDAPVIEVNARGEHRVVMYIQMPDGDSFRPRG